MVTRSPFFRRLDHLGLKGPTTSIDTAASATGTTSTAPGRPAVDAAVDAAVDPPSTRRRPAWSTRR